MSDSKQRIHIQFFRACGLASGRTSFASSRMATSDRFRAQNQAVRLIDSGVVRFCERLLHHDSPTDKEVRQAGEWVARKTKAAVADMDNYQAMTFVGTAGAVTSLAAMVQKLPAYELTRIYNYRPQLDTIQELEQMLLSRKKADRAGLPGLEKGRDEIIAIGTISIQTIMEAPAKQACLVSDLSLREGIL